MGDPRPLPTRDALAETAMRLFAERGVFEVSLAQIVREAGQRNASAVHYHFGSRDQLLIEILAPTVEQLRDRRRQMLAALDQLAADDPRPVVEAIVTPLLELAHQGWQGRAWMKIGTELSGAFDRVTPEIEALLQRAGGTEALEVLRHRCPPLPDAIWSMRTNVCIGFTSRAALDRARAMDEGRSLELSDEAFHENLVDIFLGALRA